MSRCCRGALTVLLSPLFAVALLDGCGGDGLEPATEECVEGLWIDPAQPGGCPGCEPGTPPQYRTDECDRGDCVEATVDLHRRDGSSFQFTARWSESRGTVSVVLGCSGFVETTWSVNEEGDIVRVSGGGTETSVEGLCGDGRLQTFGYQEWERARPALESVLESVPERDECQGLPYTP